MRLAPCTLPRAPRLQLHARTSHAPPTHLPRTSHAPPTHLPRTSHAPPTHLPRTSHAPPTHLPRTSQVLLGLGAEQWAKWGVHYCRTLPLMLRTERRSNFRDRALQHFGRDATGRETMFEEESSAAEMTFATLKAPEPSLLQPQAPVGVPFAAGAAVAGHPAPTAQPAQRLNVLPDEFMRGGGCFAPEALVSKVVMDASGHAPGAAEAEVPLRMDAVRAGDLLRTADGGAARVRCVVATECEGGHAELVALPGSGSCELTSWHPVRDPARGEWRFPCTLGTPRVRACAHVFNLVLDREHVLLVGGAACVTLGHGLRGDVVGHSYWGGAVLADLSRQPGWTQGFVLLRPGQLQGQLAAANAAESSLAAGLVSAEA
jgi:hypothetical protein